MPTSNWLRVACVPATVGYYHPPGAINHPLMDKACREGAWPAEFYQRGFFSFACPAKIERDHERRPA